MHFRPDLEILGYLPTLCEEQRSEAQEILAELEQRYPDRCWPPIHKSTDLAYAHSSHMDVFTYRPPRQRQPGQLASSSRATQEYRRPGECCPEQACKTGAAASSRIKGTLV